MSRVTFENYGRAARCEADLTTVSGRYRLQKLAERRIVSDVAAKLGLQPTDSLLEIGCGPGNLLIPMSFMVENAVGIDHPDVCKKLKERFTDTSVQTVGANFFDYKPDADQTFDAVLIYSVLNTLSDEFEAMKFVQKAAGLLAPGGRMLIGDIANCDRKRRFLDSQTGKEFQRDWNAKMQQFASEQSSEAPTAEWKDDPDVFQPDDAFISKLFTHFRGAGYDVQVQAQPPDLPFGRTREDVLVVAPD